jgi:hypothetical protein
MISDLSDALIGPCDWQVSIDLPPAHVLALTLFESRRRVPIIGDIKEN